MSNATIIETVAQDVEYMMWEEVVKAFPAASTGEFPFDASFALTEALVSAIALWVELNVPAETV